MQMAGGRTRIGERVLTWHCGAGSRLSIAYAVGIEVLGRAWKETKAMAASVRVWTPGLGGNLTSERA